MNKNKTLKKAFTLVELIVVITILTILATIGFASYSKNIPNSRNNTRISTLNKLKSDLELQKQNKAVYPLPSNYFNITNNDFKVAYQGFLNSKTLVTEIDDIPYDPYKNNDYVYSTTRQKSEIQLATTLENYGDLGKAYLVGNYKTVSRNVLPTIILAKNAAAGTNVEIHDGVGQGSINRKLFIFDDNIHNLPYDFDSLEPYSDGTDFDTLLDEALNSKTFIQNSNYRTCEQIQEENKQISTGSVEEKYFIVENGALTETGCTF